MECRDPVATFERRAAIPEVLGSIRGGRTVTAHTWSSIEVIFATKKLGGGVTSVCVGGGSQRHTKRRCDGRHPRVHSRFDGPVSERAIDHGLKIASFRASAWRRAKIRRGKDTRRGDGNVPVGCGSNRGVDSKESIFKLQCESRVPSHESRRKVCLVPATVSRSTGVLGHKIVIRAKVDAVRSLALIQTLCVGTLFHCV